MPRAAVAISAVTRSAFSGWATHAPRRAGDRRPVQLVADDGLGQEVLADEVAEVRPQRVLLGGDDRGVRDRQAQRTAEERRHGEPVGERTHHPRLGGGVHEPDPARCAARLATSRSAGRPPRPRAGTRSRAPSSAVGHVPAAWSSIRPMPSPTTTRGRGGTGSTGDGAGGMPATSARTHSACPRGRPAADMDLAGVDGVPPTPATSWCGSAARGKCPSGAAPLGAPRPPGAVRRPRQRRWSRAPARGRLRPHDHGRAPARPAADVDRHHTDLGDGSKDQPERAGATRQCT